MSLRFSVMATVGVWLVSAPIVCAQSDPFLAQREAELAKGDTGGFSIAFADGRRTFHVGELPIRSRPSCSIGRFGSR